MRLKAQLTRRRRPSCRGPADILAWDPLGKKLVITQVYDHHGNVGMNTTRCSYSMPGEHAA